MKKFLKCISTIGIRLWKYLPFVVHFLLIAGVAVFMLLYVNGRKFNLTAREPTFMESDGSISRHSHYNLLQSDVTTIVSLAASVTRVAAGWWGASLVWRCILLFMRRGKISLKGLKQATQTIPFRLCGLGNKGDRTILVLVVIATFSLDYFASALTGSITWSQAYDYAHGNVSITGIKQSAVGMSLENYRNYTEDVLQTITLGTTIANSAWGTSDGAAESVGVPILKRVLDNARNLSINSTVQNLTLPYFTVEYFEWIQDPNATLTDTQKFHISEAENHHQYNPYFAEPGKLGLIPDGEWGPLLNLFTPDPHIVSETRILSYRIARVGGGGCEGINTTDFGAQILPFTVPISIGSDCFAMAKVTYTAGAAVCRDCRLASARVFQHDGPLSVIPDSLTAESLALAPVLGTYMIFSGQSIPQNPASPQDFAIGLMSRSYQAGWTALTNMYASSTEQTETSVSVLMTQADVLALRVYLWVTLHMLILAGGLTLVYIHIQCNHPWVSDPMLAVFLLDNGDVMKDRGWKHIDHWKAKGDGMPEGFVTIAEGDHVHRSLKLERQAMHKGRVQNLAHMSKV